MRQLEGLTHQKASFLRVDMDNRGFFFSHEICGIFGRDIEIYLLDPLTRSDQAQCRVAVETQKDLERRLERAELREVGQRKGILGTTLGSWKPTVCRWFLLAVQKGCCDEF